MKHMILIVAVLLAGCATDPAPPAIPAVTITPPVYCEIYTKITWSKEDTWPTVRGIQRENAKFDRICAPKKIAWRGDQ